MASVWTALLSASMPNFERVGADWGPSVMQHPRARGRTAIASRAVLVVSGDGRVAKSGADGASEGERSRLGECVPNAAESRRRLGGTAHSALNGESDPRSEEHTS